MKVVIIEDEQIAIRQLQRLLSRGDPSIEVIQTLQSVRAAVEWLNANGDRIDLIFLDIQLTDGLSFQIFETVTINCPIIFTTAFDEYAIKAFQLNSIDYLLKPVKQVELSRAIDKYKSLEKKEIAIDYQQLAQSIKLQEKQYKTRFLVKSGTSLQPIPIDQIAYFIADGNLVLLVAANGKRYPINYALGELEGQLDPQFFFRINRQIMTHIQGIHKVDTWFKGKLTVQLSPSLSEKTIISQQKAALFKNWLDGA